METTDNKRLFLAVGVSMAILLVWQLFFFDAPKPPAEEEQAQEQEEEAGAEPGADGEPGATGAEDPAAPDADAPPRTDALVAAIPEAEAVLETDHYRLVLTNVGARSLAFSLKIPERYDNIENFLGPLIAGSAADELAGLELPLVTQLKGIGLDAHSRFAIVESPEDGGVAMRWVASDGSVEVEKTFRAGENPYGIEMAVTIKNLGTTGLSERVSLSLFNRQGEGDEPGFFGPGRPVEASCMTEDDVERVDPGDEAETYDGSVNWIAVSEQYFVTIAVPVDAESCRVEGFDDGLLEASATNEVNVPPGDTVSVTYELYFGPKESAPLNAFGRDVNRTLNYGWFEFIARPIAWLLFKLHGFFGNWGLAIIMLTILIRGLLWPITQRSQESMMRMKDVSPQLKKLQEKYKNDPTLLQQKQMALFKENNVSPFGCLPLLLQIPIWFALYRVIFVTAELYRADFALWLHDLSAPDPYYILPVIAGGLFFVQQKLSPTSITDVRQKVLMTVFPLVFVVVMLFLPSGLNLYILVSSVIGVSQVIYTRRKQSKAKPKTAKSDGDDDEEREPSTAQERRAAKRRKRSSD